MKIRILFVLNLIFFSIIAARGAAPTWTVNPASYQYNMTMVAVANINCVELSNPSNRIGVFVGSQCRGTALTSQVVSGRYTSSLFIYSNNVSGDTIRLKVYNAALDSVFDVSGYVLFQQNASYGTASSPYVAQNNSAPTDISLSASEFSENTAINATVATLSATDADAGESFSYSLVSGTGSADNAKFSISGSNLRLAGSVDYETQKTCTIRVRVNDGRGCTFDKVLSLSVSNYNEPPSAISISDSTIFENTAALTVFGTLFATDSDSADAATFTLVSGTGSTDNASFNISGSSLRSTQIFNYEVKSSYSIRVRVRDGANNTFERQMTILIKDQNDAPTNILVNGSSAGTSFPENRNVGSLLATLSTTDEDVANTFTYSFVNAGGNDNSSFQLVGNQIRSNASFDFETRQSYSVFIQTSDGNGGTLSKQFLLSVSDSNDAPTAISLSGSSVYENLASGTFVARISTSDPDASQTNFTYSLVAGAGSAGNANFFIRNDSLFTNAMFNYEALATQSIRIQTTDPSSLTFSQSFVISILDANDNPTDINITTAQVAENLAVNSTIGNFSTSDQDASNTFIYSLVTGTGSTDNALFNISGNALRTSAIFDFETKSSYSIRVKTNDGNNGTFEKVFTVTITNDNDAPTNITLSNNNFTENRALNSIVGTLSSTDQDASNTFTYSFSNISGNDNSSFVITGSTLRSAMGFNYEAKNLYYIYITTNDGNGGTFTKQFQINITDSNDAPIALNLSNTSIQESLASGSFIGKLSTTDPDVANTTFAYSLVSGTGSSGNASFLVRNDSLFSNAVFNYETAPSYSIRLRTSDLQGGTLEQTFTITVLDANDAPTDITLSSSEVAENLSSGSNIGTLTAVDQDNSGTYSYTLISGTGATDNASFTISGSTLKTAAIFDFETKSSYSIRIRTSDGLGGTFEKVFTITITNANDVPTNISLSNNSLTENRALNSLVGTLSTSDQDVANTFSYSFATTTGSDNSSFVISGNQLRTAQAFNYEEKNIFYIYITTNDGNGGTFTKQFQINITDSNDAPTDITLNSPSILENKPAGSYIGTLSTTDADAVGSFTYTLVAGTGATDNSYFFTRNDSLFALSALDFETKNTYYIRLRTTDNGNLNFQKAFVINVVNDNDPPTDIVLTGNTINENTAVNTNIGTFSSVDPDTANSFTYALVPGTGSTNNNLFTIVGNQLKSYAIFNFEVQRNFSIRVQTSDGNGGTFSKSLTIQVVNTNDAPTQIALSNTSITENRAAGTIIGNLSATDEDSAATHSFSLVNNQPNDNSSFVIQNNQLKSNAVFNYESKTIYTVNIQANDGNGGTFDRVFLITIVDSNDAPTNINLSNTAIDENLSAGAFIGNLSVDDPDATSSSNYSLVAGAGATDNSAFQIRNDSLFALNSFDFETKSSYAIRVRATDNGALSFDKQFTISVRNKNDNPVDLSLDNNAINENSAIGTSIGLLSTNDPDSGNTFTYSLVTGTGSTDNASFTIVGNELRSFAQFNFEAKRTYAVRIQTNDGRGGVFSKAFTVNIININDNPTNILISNTSIKENKVANSLVGLLSTVDEDTANTFNYSFSSTQNSDNNMFIISGNQLNSNTSFNYEAKNVYVVLVKTNDGNGGIFEKQIVINILDSNDAPVNMSLNNNSLNENLSANTFIGILSTEDPDATGSFNYSLVTGNGSTDNAFFTVRFDSLFAAQSFDFENKASYSIRTRTTDQGNLSFEKSFTIAVNDVNDNPTAILLSNTSFSENLPARSFVATLTASDPDAVNSFSYAFATGTGATDNALFSISGNELRTNASFNYEVRNAYSIRLRVSDGRGGSFEDVFNLTVSDSNDAPSDIMLSTTNVAENRKIGSLVAVISTSDQDVGDMQNYSFANTGINNNNEFIIVNNELRTASVFNYENKSFYIIYLTTTDSKGAALTKQFLINVTDSTDAPTELFISNNKVQENSSIKTFVGLLTSTDADQFTGFNYSLVGGAGANDNNSFSISNDSLYTALTFNFEQKNTYQIRIRTTDATAVFYEKSFDISILDNNDAPTLIALSNNSIPENEKAGFLVASLSATDEDASEVFNYSLVSGTGSTDNNLFTITNGKLLTNFSANYEVKNTYSVRIQTKDKANATFEQSFTIDITDVNESPSLKLDTFSISEDATLSSVVGNCNFSDPDNGQTVSYRLIPGTEDLTPFTLSSTGTLTLNGTLDYEAAKSYTLQVIIIDNGNPNLADTGLIVVNVIDVIEKEKALPVINYMSPNGDGVNDFFAVSNVDLYKNYSLTIYNENGLVVYKTLQNYNNDWDGTYNGNALPTGVYYFVFSNPTDNAEFKGSITIVKP